MKPVALVPRTHRLRAGCLPPPGARHVEGRDKEISHGRRQRRELGGLSQHYGQPIRWGPRQRSEEVAGNRETARRESPRAVSSLANTLSVRRTAAARCPG